MTSVLVWQSLPNSTGWTAQQQTRIVLSSGGWTCEIKVPPALPCGEVSLSVLQMAMYSLCPHQAPSMRLRGEGKRGISDSSLFLQGHLSYQIRTLCLGSHLILAAPYRPCLQTQWHWGLEFVGEHIHLITLPNPIYRSALATAILHINNLETLLAYKGKYLYSWSWACSRDEGDLSWCWLHVDLDHRSGLGPQTLFWSPGQRSKGHLGMQPLDEYSLKVWMFLLNIVRALEPHAFLLRTPEDKKSWTEWYLLTFPGLSLCGSISDSEPLFLKGFAGYGEEEGCWWGGKAGLGKGQPESRGSAQTISGAGDQGTLQIKGNCLWEV